MPETCQKFLRREYEQALLYILCFVQIIPSALALFLQCSPWLKIFPTENNGSKMYRILETWSSSNKPAQHGLSLELM